ncbi:MAG: LysM peptidoglycan-binding domain-containing protein, partial [Betaproteobacteria bacterium]
MGDWRGLVMVTMGAVMLSGCASRMAPAPVESRTIPGASAPSVKRAGGGPAAPPTAAAPTAPATRPSAEASSSLAPDGFYRIKRGDTLIGISLDHGVSWRDLAGWNQIDNPNLIEVDQLIRVRPPAVTAPASATRNQETRPMEVRPIGPIASAPTSPPAGAGPAAPAPRPLAAADTITLSWPGRGQVIT